MIVNNGQVYVSPSLQRDELYAEIAGLVVAVVPEVKEGVLGHGVNASHSGWAENSRGLLGLRGPRGLRGLRARLTDAKLL